MSVKETLTALADAIREKTGKTEPLTLEEMTAAVKTIGGAAENSIRYVTVDANGFPTEIDASTMKQLARCQFSSSVDAYNSDYPLYSKVTKITLSDEITEFPSTCFYRCTKLSELHMPASLKTIGRYCFTYCSALPVSIPEGVETIEPYAFSTMNNTGFTALTLPASLTAVRANAFRANSSLTAVTFLGTPTTVATSVFNDCANLTDIYVPWAEGAVTGAPWGAANATVHYNS